MLTSNSKLALALICAGFIILAGSPQLRAGNYWLVSKSGEPCRWDGGTPIRIYPDAGGLGKYSNLEAISKLLLPALNAWSDVPTAHVRWNFSTPMAGDIASLNDLDLALRQGYSPIVFDQGGKILAALGAPTQYVIGLTGMFIPSGTTLTQGFIIINGLMVDGISTNGEITEQQMLAALIHELGHFLNLDHSQVNGHMFLGNTDDPSYRRFGPPPADSVEIMYPYNISGVSRPRLTHDDESAISMLYPGPSFLETGFISGRIFLPDMATPFQGANVIARNASNPFYDAISSVSGNRYLGRTGGSPDIQLKGLYEIGGLIPGGAYLVEMANIPGVSSSGSATGPLFPHALLPGPEEFWSGAGESPVDDPMMAQPLIPESAKGSGSINIFLNAKMGPSLHYGETVSGSIASPVESWAFTIDAGKDDYVSIRMKTTSGFLNPAMSMSGPAGELLGSSTGAAEARLGCRLPATGSYIILSSDKDRKYSGGFELAASKFVPQPLTFYQTRNDRIDSKYQTNGYELLLAAGDVIRLQMTPGTGSSIAPQFDLYDPDGGILQQMGANGGLQMDVAIPRSGTYLLLVSDLQGSGAGSYGLTMSCRQCRLQQSGASSTMYFPYFNHAANELQGLAVSNFSGAESSLRFRAYTGNGALLADVKEKVRAKGQLARMSEQIFGTGTMNDRGWVEVVSETPSQNGMFQLFDPPVTRMDGTEASAHASEEFVFPEILEGSRSHVELTLLNPTTTAASATLELIDAEGKIIALRSVSLRAKGLWSGTLSQTFPGRDIPATSYVRCSSNIALVGSNLMRTSDALAVSHPADTQEIRSILYSPQIAAGGGLYTRISIVNNSSALARLTITAFDERGNRHVKASTNDLVRTLPGRGKITLDVAENFGMGTAAQMATGWLKIVSNVPVGMVGTVTFGSTDGKLMSVLPLDSIVLKEAVVPHIAQNAFYYTGVAALNVSTAKASVKVVVFDSNGVSLGSSMLTLNPGERIAKLVSELVPTVVDQTSGYMILTADQDLVLTSLFGSNNLSVLSAIPAQPLNK
jgi:hypothetical protein